MDLPAGATLAFAGVTSSPAGAPFSAKWYIDRLGDLLTHVELQSVSAPGSTSGSVVLAGQRLNIQDQLVDLGAVGGQYRVELVLNGVVIAATPIVTLTAAPPVDLAAPSGLTAADRANDQGGSVTLAWTPSSSPGVIEQRVYRSLAAGGPYALQAVLNGNAASGFPDGGLENGTTYYYVVRAFDGLHESAASNEAAAVPADNVAPAAPTGLRTVDSGGAASQLTLRWATSVSPDVVRQRLYRSLDSGGPYTRLADFDDNLVNRYVDAELLAGERYYYVLRSFDGTQWSAFSDELEAALSSRRGCRNCDR
jgi:hypothetical protein